MSKKVKLKELVATKIIYAFMLVIYYWMWSRTDWKDYYLTIHLVLGLILVAFFIFQGFRVKKYNSEHKDELAEHNLRRCDSICFKVLLALLTILAVGIAIISHSNEIHISLVGWIIVILILLISVLRTTLFIIMDSKGV